MGGPGGDAVWIFVRQVCYTQMLHLDTIEDRRKIARLSDLRLFHDQTAWNLLSLRLKKTLNKRSA